MYADSDVVLLMLLLLLFILYMYFLNWILFFCMIPSTTQNFLCFTRKSMCSFTFSAILTSSTLCHKKNFWKFSYMYWMRRRVETFTLRIVFCVESFFLFLQSRYFVCITFALSILFFKQKKIRDDDSHPQISITQANFSSSHPLHTQFKRYIYFELYTIQSDTHTKLSKPKKRRQMHMWMNEWKFCWENYLQ